MKRLLSVLLLTFAAINLSAMSEMPETTESQKMRTSRTTAKTRKHMQNIKTEAKEMIKDIGDPKEAFMNLIDEAKVMKEFKSLVSILQKKHKMITASIGDFAKIAQAKENLLKACQNDQPTVTFENPKKVGLAKATPINLDDMLALKKQKYADCHAIRQALLKDKKMKAKVFAMRYIKNSDHCLWYDMSDKGFEDRALAMIAVGLLQQ